jgi:hypothetical protein
MDIKTENIEIYNHDKKIGELLEVGLGCELRYDKNTSPTDSILSSLTPNYKTV